MATIPMETLAPTKNRNATNNKTQKHSFKDAVSFVFNLLNPTESFSGYGRSSMGPLFTWPEDD